MAKQHPIFNKLEPLNDHLRQAFKQYWTPGTHLAVDETIQRFMGHATETVNIPSKPDTEGYMIWVLANAGYVLDWVWHAKGDGILDGPQDICDFWTGKGDCGFLKTQAVVLDLLTQEGIATDGRHIVGAGTVRTTKTAREEDEASHGTKAQRKNARKEQNRGMPRSLCDLKLIHNVQIEWGMLYGVISDNGEVSSSHGRIRTLCYS